MADGEGGEGRGVMKKRKLIDLTNQHRKIVGIKLVAFERVDFSEQLPFEIGSGHVVVGGGKV